MNIFKIEKAWQQLQAAPSVAQMLWLMVFIVHIKRLSLLKHT
jgi:hypothetical protein